jgi:hypothetical protein
VSRVKRAKFLDLTAGSPWRGLALPRRSHQGGCWTEPGPSSPIEPGSVALGVPLSGGLNPQAPVSADEVALCPPRHVDLAPELAISLPIGRGGEVSLRASGAALYLDTPRG